ncbi:uncharacterized protein LOC106463247 [Limulus polyphemus]|uniref:Uncharacterized protein LOC106463247 n=1 Tax=Limulus polyphemus TaxID=6850 RepID=A0ABM1BBJ5_LIMPO|nr:uncharacterized protein LOC106463247 [Limulus polyphemus]
MYCATKQRKSGKHRSLKLFSRYLSGKRRKTSLSTIGSEQSTANKKIQETTKHKRKRSLKSYLGFGNLRKQKTTDFEDTGYLIGETSAPYTKDGNKCKDFSKPNNTGESNNKPAKKKKLSKRIRRTVMTACRYIGVGLANMAPTVGTPMAASVENPFWYSENYCYPCTHPSRLNQYGSVNYTGNPWGRNRPISVW